MATPVSLMEWFLNFWDQAMEGPVQPLQGTVGPGEVIFVPSGWWHMAINLEVRQLFTYMCHKDCQAPEIAPCAVVPLMRVGILPLLIL